MPSRKQGHRPREGSTGTYANPTALFPTTYSKSHANSYAQVILRRLLVNSRLDFTWDTGFPPTYLRRPKLFSLCVVPDAFTRSRNGLRTVSRWKFQLRNLEPSSKSPSRPG